MNPIGAALVALVVGLGLGALAVWIGLRSRRPDPSAMLEPPGSVVPAGVAEVLSVLNSAGVVVGRHDEVLEATSTARTTGLVRGSRIVPPRLLELVRAVRRERTVATSDLQLSRGYGAPASYFTVKVAPLGRGPDSGAGGRPDRLLARSSRSAATSWPMSATSSRPRSAPSRLLAEAVQEGADDPQAVRKFASRMGVESARLSDLVAQIIDLSQLQGDNPLVDPEVVEVDEVISDAVDRRRVDAEKRQVTLTIAGTTGSQVLGSARQLGVAVGNLVENAVVYSDPGARVVVGAHVSSRGEDNHVEITVSDNGIGIPAAEHERIFERFYRVDYARSRANGGTGLGLSIVKHIAAMHGGDVSVWSQVGRGSTFTIEIPAHVPPAAPSVPHVHEHARSDERQEASR